MMDLPKKKGRIIYGDPPLATGQGQECAVPPATAVAVAGAVGNSQFHHDWHVTL